MDAQSQRQAAGAWLPSSIGALKLGGVESQLPRRHGALQLATQFSVRLGRRRKKDVPADVFHRKVQAAELKRKHANSIPDDFYCAQSSGDQPPCN